MLLPASPSIKENIPKTARNVNTGARNLCGTEAEIKAGVRSMWTSRKTAMICAKGYGNLVSVIFFLGRAAQSSSRHHEPWKCSAISISGHHVA